MRTCACGCGQSLVGLDRRRQFFSDACRKASKRKARPAPDVLPPSTAVADALRVELEDLGVASSYEGVVALGIAAQLDNGTVAGAAYASLSKELDRRVWALRVKAEKADNPVTPLKQRVAEKRSA